MAITLLKIDQLRNIEQAEIICSPHFNIFFGNNAAGKSSILEAIYYLGTWKSFRTHQSERVINSEADNMTLFAQVESGQSILPIGLQRFRDGSSKIRISEQSVSSITKISHYLPIQFIASDSHRILSDGPKCRRQFLDWGLFHTNPSFYSLWKNFQKLLAQRNIALKSHASQKELAIWNREFALVGEQLNQRRQRYVSDFLPGCTEISRVLVAGASLSLNYFSAWDTQLTLETCLNQNVSRETLAGHSLFGPQRANLEINVDNFPAEDGLSQGQQKLVSYALRLAQGLQLQSTGNKTPVYLIDDLPSEFDLHNRKLVIEILLRLRAQVFVTGIESCDFIDILALHADNKMFHVKHGTISELSNGPGEEHNS